jgi:VIT1/CCC1 family predicted Fe2+/Mn2+ transporter
MRQPHQRLHHRQSHGWPQNGIYRSRVLMSLAVPPGGEAPTVYVVRPLAACGARGGEQSKGRRSSMPRGQRHDTPLRWRIAGSGRLRRSLVAAVSSLLLFAVGAFVPLLPWFFTAGGPAVAASAAVTALASLAVGAVLGIGSGRRRVARTAARQLLIVAAASAVTYALGALGGDAVS